MNKQKTIKLDARGREIELALLASSYSSNGNLAVLSYDAQTHEPFQNVTVNLDFLCPGYAYLDTNNFPDIKNALEKLGIIKDERRQTRSGYVSYPLVQFDIGVLKQYVMPDSDYFMLAGEED